MEEITLICKSCGEETMRLPKPEPQNAREAKQILFHCEYCGAKNLRDGTVRTKKMPVSQEVPEVKKEESSAGKVIGPIITVALGLATLIFLRKAMKSKEGGPGSISGSPDQSGRLPWNPIR